MSKEKMTTTLNGEQIRREIDYSAYRGKDEEGNQKFIDYPKLQHSRGRYEHIFEDENGVKVYTSLVA